MIRMQARFSNPSMSAEFEGLLPAKPQTQKREWRLKLAKILFVFIVFGIGMLLGIMFSRHMSQYMLLGKSVSLSGLVVSAHPFAQVNPQKESLQLSVSAWLAGPSIRNNMSDDELLWLASMSPRRPGLPIKRVSKVAFMFLTKGPLPLAPMWERFFKGNEGLYSIYVHTRPEYTLDFPASSVFHGRKIQSEETSWGDISMYNAERRLLANALLDSTNERFVLLSESCIPLHPFSVVYHHVIFSEHSFVNAFDDPREFGRGRYNSNMSPTVKLEQWRKGSQWFEVNRVLAVYIVSDTFYYPLFRDFCTPRCYVDEHYLPTMLSIEFPSKIANTSLTWVNWPKSDSHPAKFGKNDITEQFMRSIRDVNDCLYNGKSKTFCFLFARKFSPDTLEPLLELASDIMGF